MLIEIRTFRLAQGTDDSRFLTADATAQEEFFYQQPGLVRRTVGRSDDGRWAAVCLWLSQSEADDAAERAEAHAAATALADLVENEHRDCYATLD